MVASEDGQLFSLEGSALAQLALVVGEDFDAADAKLRRHLVQHVKLVAREEVVLKIRFARLMAWMKRTDVSLVDYPGWTAFVNEKSYWKESRTRELIRFVDSGLDHIMMLVACKVIPLCLGIRASKELPRNASEYDQLTWLADAVEKAIRARDRSLMREPPDLRPRSWDARDSFCVPTCRQGDGRSRLLLRQPSPMRSVARSVEQAT